MRPVIVVKEFLKQRSDAGRPLILGLSGGMDSLYLFHALNQCSGLYSTLHIAHVDHRWREESEKEARKLKDLAAGHGLPFHLHVIDKEAIEGNLEDACREERIRFFQGVAQETGAQAVVLGHHADDQAETVLKRVLEGAPLVSSTGIKPVSARGGVSFWRPLLSVSKSKIEADMRENGLEWLEDSTNRDPAYLRARMRQRILPLLIEEFGKNVAPSLCRHGKEIEEIADYLDYATAAYRPIKFEGPFGVCYDFSRHPPKAVVEWKYLIKACCRSENFVIGHEKLAVAVNLLQTSAANKEIQCGGKTFIVDRRRIFYLEQVQGEWEPDEEHAPCCRNSDWTDIFQGRACAEVPKGQWHQAFGKKGMIYRGSSTLAQWWSQNKIPLCVRELAPVLVGQNRWLHEFLTGRCRHNNGEKQKVFLKFKKCVASISSEFFSGERDIDKL